MSYEKILITNFKEIIIEKLRPNIQATLWTLVQVGIQLLEGSPNRIVGPFGRARIIKPQALIYSSFGLLLNMAHFLILQLFIHGCWSMLNAKIPLFVVIFFMNCFLSWLEATAPDIYEHLASPSVTMACKFHYSYWTLFWQILQRLVSTLDRCASRTCSLPVETVELMPSHCSRFSLACLQKLFLLSR